MDIYNIYIYMYPHIVMYLVRAMCRIQSVLCAGFSLCHVRDSLCVMCGIQSVVCVGFSLCYVRPGLERLI